MGPAAGLARMHPTAKEFVERAREEYDLEVELHEFPEGTKTAEDAANAIGCAVAQIGSSLVFVADEEPVIVVTSGANHVSEQRLAEYLDATAVSMADPDAVRDATGWGIGGVPPFCHDTDLAVFIDETLMQFDEIWVAAGTPQAVFPIDPEHVVEIADATPIAVAE